tara:strand:+ start:1548 stop:2891 length:1344 start_codon:yes stop_codon:yes gene_type:complete
MLKPTNFGSSIKISGNRLVRLEDYIFFISYIIMASITGLQSGEFTDIDVVYSISIDGDAGQTGQVLSSDGQNTLWIDGGAIDREDLTAADTTITISGTGSYDGQVARTIQTNKVPNALTAGTNVGFSSGTTYDGSSALTITSTDTNTQLVLAEGSGITITNIGGLNRRIAANIDADTINFDGDELTVSKVPNALIAGTNISFSSGTTYDGSSAITITSTDTNTQLNLTEGNGITISNTGGVNRTITLNADSSTLSNNVGSGQAGVLKVPNALTAGTGISFNSGTTYDGSGAKTISATAPLPAGVFLVSGDLRMTINLANFMTNDDSTYYNIISEDDGSSKIHGAIKPANAVVEIVGYFVIPSGYEASGARVDVTDSGGSGITRDLTFESFTTYGGTSFAALGDGPTGSEQSFDAVLTAASDKLLMIKISTTATTDHVRGGYIVIEES